ncbi:aldo/keto reductase [Parahalioglobus pacificus]|uniref:Aldo/keto reductase n=1 Tax=Parahalioglobus pacificus TaxID=930806 RepID=A0A918XL19_9GAMM|nr:aldo/keto reductase [Halioglobus pacificus]GHD35949.1 aldo/keto reductase [Halioglobus pacificus]
MINRRQLLQYGASAAAAASLGLNVQAQESAPMITRAIPSSGEAIPVVGMGTSRTFDTPDDADSIALLKQVMQSFFANGGKVIDSSPMYGNAESRVGDVIRGMEQQPPVFAATKVWTTGKDAGIAQMEESARRMAVDTFDLIAVHNLQDWETHMATLKDWKEQGKVRYIGITTSHGRSHDEFIKVMKTEPIDFVQFSYNIMDRAAEESLFPVAQEQGIATMINRPYQRGSLFAKTRGKDLPDVAADIDVDSWGQFFLKFILAHPGVTSIIPATSKVHHMDDNMKANLGRVPDSDQREEMLRVFASL